ncbi:MAG TPA: hypothetical protein VHC71_11940 [Hyphomicrobium sp.]|nr:hypothetical protein [Hyphomicrobium sp.]
MIARIGAVFAVPIPKLSAIGRSWRREEIYVWNCIRWRRIGISTRRRGRIIEIVVVIYVIVSVMIDRNDRTAMLFESR